jgi:hypothetical protein
VSGKVNNVKVLLERMDYNNRIRSFNLACVSQGDLPLLRLLNVNGYHINICWRWKTQDGTAQKILDWITRFGLELGTGTMLNGKPFIHTRYRKYSVGCSSTASDLVDHTKPVQLAGWLFERSHQDCLAISRETSIPAKLLYDPFG